MIWQMSFYRFRKHGLPGNTETNVDGGKKSCTQVQGISLNSKDRRGETMRDSSKY